MTQENIELIAECIEKYYLKAKSLYPNSLQTWTRPTFDLKKRGTTSGCAFLRENRMSFNAALFLENKKSFFERTIPHEVAHLVAARVFRDMGHGPGWKKVMVDFGISPNRCHNYDVSSVKQNYTKRRAEYFCGCRTHLITLQKHRSKSNYRCRICKGDLKFTGIIKTIN